MQVKHVVISCLLGLLAVSNAHAGDKSCKELIGEKRAQMLVKQCINVSPATHPPCNASNSCYMIIEEIDRGCQLLGKDGNKLNYCSFDIAKQETLTGVLIAGGGMDDNGITVLTDDGRRAWGYCSDRCGEDMFVSEGEEGTTLNPSMKGKSVSVTFAKEPNKSRIAGPDENEMLIFVKKIQFIK
jgi:hypothetical protein